MNVLISVLTFIAFLPLQIPQMVLPDGNGSWVVQVVSSGGLLGTGGGEDFAMSSEGKIVCKPEMRCSEQFALSDLQPLLDVFQPTTLPAPAPQVVSLCRDCITQTITISRRDSIGVVSRYAASWDVTTKSSVPPEVIRIYDAALALRK
jgi:hypothetical protein